MKTIVTIILLLLAVGVLVSIMRTMMFELESNEVYEETDFEPFDDFLVYLYDRYPQIYKIMEVDTVNTYGLVFHWKGRDSVLPPVLFLSHYDVVPVAGYDLETKETMEAEGGVSTGWDFLPLSGTVMDKQVNGREVLDMKCMLFSLMESADSLIAEGFQPQRDIWFTFGHEEEVTGRKEVFRIAKYFKKKGLHFDVIYDNESISLENYGKILWSFRELLKAY